MEVRYTLMIQIGLIVSIVVNVILLIVLWRKIKFIDNDHITEDTIREMIEVGGDNGSIDLIGKDMIHNIFELGKTSVGEIATHRRDIVAISKDATLEEIIEVVAQEKYSRIIIYGENIDNIIGLLHVKDFVKYIMLEEDQRENFRLEELLKNPFFVPFSKKTNELFQEMQREKVHMAIIIDEYGGTAGIVTMEDMIEEIVGNIFDEYDLEEEEDITMLEDGTYRISGSCDIDDVADVLELEFSDNEDYDTLGGYLVGRLGRIPEEDEKIEIQENNWMFRVEKIEEKRIEKILALPIRTENGSDKTFI